LTVLSDSGAQPAPVVGVRHWITASVLPLQPSPSGSRRASLRLRIRVSDHAIDQRFYGVVAAEWRELDLAVGSPDRVVWEDTRCHRERGTPKMSILALDGEDDSRSITAMVRQRGLRLPSDEIVERKVLEPLPWPGVLAVEATTKMSGVRVRVTLHAQPCRIDES
jgi:hypothetical protein